MDGFVHLAATTCFSLRDGVIRPRALAEAVTERGMDAVGIADRDGLYGAVRFADACVRAGIRPILGTDLALAPTSDRPGWETSRGGRGTAARAAPGPGPRSGSGGEGGPVGPERARRQYPPRRSDGGPLGATSGAKGPSTGAAWLEDDAARVTLIARTQVGYANLCRTVTDHHLGSERSDPHLTWAQLERWAGRDDAGLFVLLADDSPVARLADAGRLDAAADEARRWCDLVGPANVLIGVTHHLAPGDDTRARARFALADRLDLRAVAHQAPRYLDPADARVADVVEAVRKQVPLDPRHCRRRNAEGYLKTPEEMARVFAERPDALRSAAEAADACHVDLGLGTLRVPDYVALGGEASEELRRRAEAGVEERFANPGSRHRDLLADELAMVARLGLAPYFLTVAEIVDRIREKGIMAACRGSAAGSLVCYALRISDVDPIAHDLVYERFMNPYRDELPDIDIDVESARREDIYRDLLDRYGTDRVACVAMVETFKARMAIREVGKALGLPANEVDYVAKSFPHVRAGDVRAAITHLPEMRGLNLDAGQLGLLFDVVERMDGFPRHLALHPCGILLGDAALRDLVPLERSAAGFAMAQFDKDDVEALGLCKLDLLAVRLLSSMAHAKEEVRRTRGTEIDFDEVSWRDEATYELIRSTRTLGMFQIESPGQRELVGKFQPEHLDDLVVDISLFRPGPVKGDMVGPFLQRRLGTSKTVLPHPILERALGETYGVIVYHEQVMRSVAALTGCDLATADLVRRRLGDPNELPAIERWLIDGAIERGVGDDVARSLWHALSQFASFGFCKAHAAAFSVPTYRSAWLKRHYLPEFVAGLLTHDPGMYPRRLLLDDARQFGCAVLPLDVNRSSGDYRVERLPAGEALALLGVRDGRPLPRGWRRSGAGGGLEEGGALVPPAGFDLGGDPADPAVRFGIRLGLQDVTGITEAEVDGLVVGRPFTSVEDLRRRGYVSAPTVEALTHAGALDVLGEVEAGAKTRRDLLLEVSERWSGLTRHRVRDLAKPEQLGLLGPEPAPGLREYRPSERVRADLEVLGLEQSRHVMTFYDGLLDHLGVTRTVDLLAMRNGQRVRVAGVKVATQTPPVKSGQRIIFLSLDDGTGVNDATFFESVHDRCAWTVFHTWLLVVEGTVHRTGRRGVGINAEAVWDLRRLMRAWQEGWLDEALAEDGRPLTLAGADIPDPAHPDGAPSEELRGAPGRSGLRIGSEPDLSPVHAFGGAGPASVRPPAAVPHGDGSPGSAVPVAWSDSRRAAEELRVATHRPDPGLQNGKPLDTLRQPGLPDVSSSPSPQPPLDAPHVTPAARLRVPRNAPYGPTRPQVEPGRPSRTGPNGTTWADPKGRHPGVDSQDVYRLPHGHPSRPDSGPPDDEGRPAPTRPARASREQPRLPFADAPPPREDGGIDEAGGARTGPRTPPAPPPRTPPSRPRRPRPRRPVDDDREPPRKLWHASPGSAGG